MDNTWTSVGDLDWNKLKADLNNAEEKSEAMDINSTMKNESKQLKGASEKADISGNNGTSNVDSSAEKNDNGSSNVHSTTKEDNDITEENGTLPGETDATPMDDTLQVLADDVKQMDAEVTNVENATKMGDNTVEENGPVEVIVIPDDDGNQDNGIYDDLLPNGCLATEQADRAQDNPDNDEILDDEPIDDDFIVLSDYEELSDNSEDEVELKTMKNGDNVRPRQRETAVNELYLTAHSFQDFKLKSELLSAMDHYGWKHPTKAQYECLPRALAGMNLVCQGKKGMGKSSIFLLATLQKLKLIDGRVSVVVIANTKQLAFQIEEKYRRLARDLRHVKIGVFVGGLEKKGNFRVDNKIIKLDSLLTQKARLKTEQPHIVIGTAGRLYRLAQEGSLNVKHVRHLVLTAFDMLPWEQRKGQVVRNPLHEMKRFIARMPYDKQVLMFSSSLDEKIRGLCSNVVNNWADNTTYQTENVHITAQKRKSDTQCKDCGQRCRDFIHTVAHECIPERAFQCKLCCANFRRASQLLRHKKSHDLPYACTMCYTRFSLRDASEHTDEECKKVVRKQAAEMTDYAPSNLWFTV